MKRLKITFDKFIVKKSTFDDIDSFILLIIGMLMGAGFTLFILGSIDLVFAIILIMLITPLKYIINLFDFNTERDPKS